MRWGKGPDIDTVGVKQTTAENLVCGTGAPPELCHGPDEDPSRKQGAYVHVSLVHFAVPQKLTTLSSNLRYTKS